MGIVFHGRVIIGIDLLQANIKQLGKANQKYRDLGRTFRTDKPIIQNKKQIDTGNKLWPLRFS